MAPALVLRQHDVMRIDVLGLPGETTAALEAALHSALDELRLDGVVVGRISDPGLMIARGVRKPPALMIDGRVVCRGRVPSADELRDLLAAARSGASGDQPMRCG